MDGDDDCFDEEEFLEDEAELYVGDGGGGGVALAGTWWDQEALKKLKRSGSPNMEDIESLSTTYRAQLGEAELAKTIPVNMTLEISSPGVERVVWIPEELNRFKDQAMYVKYVNEAEAKDSSSESDGIFKLVSFDVETKYCTWELADVRVNREKAGKGRPLSKKQREWRWDTPFNSLRLVRLYSET